MTTNITLGNQAETLVADSLIQQGYKIIARNYKERWGEIDLIGLKDDLLIFVEVKMRSKYYFDLAQVVTESKQQKIMNTASTFIADHNYHDKSCRFDVALVQLENNTPQITYLPDAFSQM